MRGYYKWRVEGFQANFYIASAFGGLPVLSHLFLQFSKLVLPQKKQSPKSGCLKIAVTEILADN